MDARTTTGITICRDRLRRTRPPYSCPAALNRLFTVDTDSRDAGDAERASVLFSEDTLMRCHSLANCTDVCPMEISPTQSILALRRRAARRLFS